MRLFLFTALLFTATSALAEDNNAAIESASRALDAGDLEQVFALLAPAPIGGPASCLYSRALREQKFQSAQHIARVLLYAERCQVQSNSQELRDQIAALRGELRKSGLGQVSLSIRPASAIAHLDKAYVGDRLLAEDELWLPLGTYRLQVVAPQHEGGVYALAVTSQDRMLVPIVLPESKAAEPVEIDLGEEAGAELGQVATAADPRPKEFKTLLAKRYQGPNNTPSEVQPPPAKRSITWPALMGAAALGAVGLGVGLQVRDHQRGAIASYTGGAALTGVALYLLLRNSSEPAAGTRIRVDEELVSLSYFTRF